MTSAGGCPGLPQQRSCFESNRQALGVLQLARQALAGLERQAPELAEQRGLLYAAALHDIGFLSVEERIDTMQGDMENLESHVRLGGDLLGRFDLFRTAAEIVRYHHKPWNARDRWEEIGRAHV